MADITDLPIMTKADAEAIGFAGFNDVPHKPIDIPDGNFTITARTTDGKRTTFFFGCSKEGGPATFIDIQYHDGAADIPNANNGRSPVFDMLTIGKGGAWPFDSRRLESEAKPSIAVILLEPIKGKDTSPGEAP
jgi:hypothetical protein